MRLHHVVLFVTAARGCQYSDMAPTGRMYPGGCAGLGAAVPGPCFLAGTSPHSVLKSVARVAGVASCLRLCRTAKSQPSTLCSMISAAMAAPYSETSERADLETTITDLITGQYDRPVRVVAFNTAEGWSADVSGRHRARDHAPPRSCRR
jgi:hypothetical protein